MGVSASATKGDPEQEVCYNSYNELDTHTTTVGSDGLLSGKDVHTREEQVLYRPFRDSEESPRAKF